MKVYRLTRAVVLILLAVCVLAKRAEGGREQNIKGQIIAFRPAERAFQAASFVLNRESFLVSLAGSKKSNPQILRLVYEHFGYTDLEGRFLAQIPILLLRVHRDAKCDETYKAFVKNSPRLRELGSESPLVDPIAFYGPFKSIEPSQDYFLRCYRLDRWKTMDER